MVKLTTLAVAATALFTVACGTPRGMSYIVLLDPSLSSTQAEDVMAGGDAWSKKVPGLEFSYLVTECRGPGDRAHAICVFNDQATPKDDAGNTILGHTGWQHGLLVVNDDDSSTVVVHTVSIDNGGHPVATYLNVVAHELGHAITHNGEHIALGNLMQPATPNSETPQAITADDVAYFWAAR
jgi:hypothetical protein